MCVCVRRSGQAKEGIPGHVVRLNCLGPVKRERREMERLSLWTKGAYFKRERLR